LFQASLHLSHALFFILSETDTDLQIHIVKQMISKFELNWNLVTLLQLPSSGFIKASKKISRSNSYHFLIINQVFSKDFRKLSFAHLLYVVTKHLLYVVSKLSAVRVLGKSLRRYLPSVLTKFQNFESVFSFLKVSISVLSSVDRLFLSLASPLQPQIEWFSS
jgi:hypothetical protein